MSGLLPNTRTRQDGGLASAIRVNKQDSSHLCAAFARPGAHFASGLD